MRKLNLNSVIKVKLTPLGVDVYYHRFDEFNKMLRNNGGEPLFNSTIPEINKDGFTEFILWDFINLYGSHFKFGTTKQVIENFNIYIEEKYLETI